MVESKGVLAMIMIIGWLGYSLLRWAGAGKPEEEGTWTILAYKGYTR